MEKLIKMGVKYAKMKAQKFTDTEAGIGCNA